MQKRTSWVWPLLGVFVLAWAGVAIGQNSAGGAFVPNTNYIVSGQWTFRTQLSPWIIEGATDDPFETTITFAEPTADRTFTVPNATSGTFLFSSLASNGIDVVNSIWGASNGLVFEGATADAFETTVAPTNVGADITLTLPGLANASGAILATTLTTNDVNVANSVWGVSNGLAFGGATGADGFEITLSPADVGADRAITIPDMGAASALLATTLTTNAPNVANSVWGVSNGIAFGGLTGADGFEITLSPADVGADRAVTIPDMGAASALLATTLTTNAPNVANSVWGVSNGIAFGGATGADGFELTLSPADVGADRAVTIPDMGAASALLASTLTTNAPDAANSIWATSNSLVFEGLTANTEELTMTVADVTADLTITWRNDPAGTYHPLTQITGDVTGGFWQIPEFGAADAEITMADNVMYVYRLYLPNWITIANAYARGSVGVDSAADDTLAVAIYEDADAGAQLTEAVSTDFAATADLTLNVADVTLGPGFYRVAVCSQDASGVQFVADTVDDEYIDVANLGAVRIGTAANACVAGDPPATTGALTTADINVPILKFGP